jgi:two-component system cell cycle response regulator
MGDDPRMKTAKQRLPAIGATTDRQRTTRAQLAVLAGPSAGRAYPVLEGETLLGRDPEAHVQADDAGVSRVHARIVGKRVDRAELTSGDRIHLGATFALSFAILDAQAERIAHQLYESSVRDALTHAYNRRYFAERFASEIAYARRHSTDLALVIFDIDHFKGVNDEHGHVAGDEVLRAVATLVSRAIRAEDVFVRYGGEEFAVLVRGIQQGSVGLLAERLRAGVEWLEVKSGTMALCVTISVGHASLNQVPDDKRSAEELVGLADERLYRAKASGRNRVCGG